jgi:drug/metabolite transporter superfamily protein YnfA
MYNIKKKHIYIFLSLSLITIGLHRLYLKKDSINERDRLFPELPFESIYIIPLFEIVSGFLIWTKLRNSVLNIWIIGCVMLTLSMLIRKESRQNVIRTYNEVFTYKSTTTCIVLHLFWIIIIMLVMP